MADVFKQSEDLKEYFEKSYGYAAFPKVGKFAFIIGIGGAGGDVYFHSKDGKGEMVKVGTSKLGMASGGWSLGLAVYSEIIFFENQDSFERFASGNFEFQAGAKVHVLNTGVESAARTTGCSETTGETMANKGAVYTNGMATFILPKIGAMIDVSAEGQKFTYSALAA